MYPVFFHLFLQRVLGVGQGRAFLAHRENTEISISTVKVIDLSIPSFSSTFIQLNASQERFNFFM